MALCRASYRLLTSFVNILLVPILLSCLEKQHIFYSGEMRLLRINIHVPFLRQIIILVRQCSSKSFMATTDGGHL